AAFVLAPTDMAAVPSTKSRRVKGVVITRTSLFRAVGALEFNDLKMQDCPKSDKVSAYAKNI
ncbi:hypothetical protein ABTL59_19400, partial [Acinetobacter baumannii]